MDKHGLQRINKIVWHPKYKEYLTKIEEYEKDRIFCKHDMTHFLDVCRLAEILWLTGDYAATKERYPDNQYPINSETIYAAGLLHDIGRWQEYETGIRHEIASANLAEEILIECGFKEPWEKDSILCAIREHRNKKITEVPSLSELIYRADKMSRSCFACKAEAECDWEITKKNMQLIY